LATPTIEAIKLALRESKASAVMHFAANALVGESMTNPGKYFRNNVANGVNLLFPAGERFFIRSVKHFVDRIEDPALRAQVQGFYAQEARHGAAHQKQFAVLRAQGYDALQLQELPGVDGLGPAAVQAVLRWLEAVAAPAAAA
jgi:predicted metal-dependent hydrolase